ncbi:MAG: recombinase RecT [Deltaproteobacteria bacterium]|nr:recombinase RecT [Deltaproteobacteria bacterium]
MQVENLLIATSDNDVDYAKSLNSAKSFEQAMKMATFLSKASFIPHDFQNKPSDCLIALQMAATLKVSPFEVMKGIYVVKGKPSFYSQFAIALANTKGPFAGRINFRTEGEGPSLVVSAYATMKDSGKEVSAAASMEMAQKEGWAKQNPKYLSMPEQMLSYKAALFLIRKHAPEVLMGMHTDDEVKEIGGSTAMNSKIEEMNRKVERKADGI